MLLINNQLYQLDKNQSGEFSKQHIWTIPTSEIKWDVLNKRLSVRLRSMLPTTYRANIQIKANEPKTMKTIVFATSSRPDPASAHRDIYEPQFIEIYKGVLISEDAELNFFLYHAPWAQGGKNFVPKGTTKALCNLYDRAKYVNKSQTKATRMVRIIQKIQGFNETELVAAARAVIKLNPSQNAIKIHEDRLANEDLRADELMALSGGLLDMATKLPDTMEGILSRDETTLLNMIQEGLDAEKIYFNGEAPQAGNSGVWMLHKGDGKHELCVVPDNQPKMDYLFTFLHEPKNEKKRLLLQSVVKELQTA